MHHFYEISTHMLNLRIKDYFCVCHVIAIVTIVINALENERMLSTFAQRESNLNMQRMNDTKIKKKYGHGDC